MARGFVEPGFTALYGFVAWISTHILFAMVLLWAYLPERVLQELGITYYPSKYWAVAVPCHVLVTIVAGYVFYWLYNLVHLPPLESFDNLTDPYSKAPDELPAWGQNEGDIPPLHDLPITTVNAVLFRRPPPGPVPARASAPSRLNAMGGASSSSSSESAPPRPRDASRDVFTVQ